MTSMRDGDRLPQGWLTVRVGREEVLSAAGAWRVDGFWQRLLAWLQQRPDPRVTNSSRRESREILQAWLETLGPSEELWAYSSPDEDWESLHGDAGFAIVDQGVIVDSISVSGS